MCKLYRILRIKVTASMAYHPQTNGQTEHINQELKQYICLFTNQCQDDWDKLLSMAKFQRNNLIHSSTQQTPFMLNTGRHLRMGFEPNQLRSHSKTVNDFADRIAKGLEESKAALAKAQSDYKLYYNH